MAIENCGFCLIPISIEFSVRNVYHHHVSGNNNSRTGTTPTTCSRNKGGVKGMPRWWAMTSIFVCIKQVSTHNSQLLLEVDRSFITFLLGLMLGQKIVTHINYMRKNKIIGLMHNYGLLERNFRCHITLKKHGTNNFRWQLEVLPFNTPWINNNY